MVELRAAFDPVRRHIEEKPDEWLAARDEKGFRKATSPEGLVRYEKPMGGYSVPVDFLTEAPPSHPRHRCRR